MLPLSTLVLSPLISWPVFGIVWEGPFNRKTLNSVLMMVPAHSPEIVFKVDHTPLASEGGKYGQG